MITQGKDNPFNDGHHEKQQGLTKRELFAAMAMQGILASGGKLNDKNLAHWAVFQSELLIKHLNQPIED